MRNRRHASEALLLFSLLLATPAAAQEATPTPSPTPPPEQGGTAAPREGWYPVGSERARPRERDRARDDRAAKKGSGHDDRGGWSTRARDDDDPWDIDDPNEDAMFFLPTGRTLKRNQLTLGFPGPGGVPDIQYGLSDWLQVGAGYTLVGFTPSARLGIIRSRRVDFTLVGGAYLPIGGEQPFMGQYVGGVLTAGKDDFRVHLGYQYVQLWGEPFPDVRSVQGGLGMTGVELRIAPRAKFLFSILSYTQINIDEEENPDLLPFSAVAVAPGIRVYGKSLSADVGVMVGRVSNLGLDEDFKSSDEYRDATFALPMITLRYQL